MTLSPEIVRKELEAFNCFRFTATPYGFDLHGSFERVTGTDGRPTIGKPVTWRLTHGGGISGESTRVWWIERKDGPPHENQSRKVTTKRDLRKIVREWLAGDAPRDPGDAVAKLVHGDDGSRYLWVKKPEKKR